MTIAVASALGANAKPPTIPNVSESSERMSIGRGSTGDVTSASLPRFVWFSNVTVLAGQGGLAAVDHHPLH